MFEAPLQTLPESALACRALYDVASGGYHLPLREHNRRLRREDAPQFRALYPQVHYDCIEVPVADLLYSLVVNTRSAHWRRAPRAAFPPATWRPVPGSWTSGRPG